MKSTLFILKKQSLRYFISGTLAAVFLLSVFIYSCKHEALESNEIITVDEAQEWYEALPNSSVKLKSGHKSNSVELKNVWENARAYKNDSLGIIEVNIMSRGKFGFMHPRSKEAMDNTGNKAYSNSLTKLVVKKNKRTNRIEGFLMTLVPTPEYIASHNFDLGDNAYLKWQSDYSGMVLYHRMSGDFVNGWEFQDGQAIRRCRQVGKNSVPIVVNRLKRAECEYVTVTFYEEACTDWYVNGNYSWSSCDAPIAYDEYVYQACTYEPFDHGDFGPGGDFREPSSTYSIIDADFYGYPCAQKAMNAMVTSNANLSQILCDVFGNGPEVNVTFVADNTMSLNDDGEYNKDRNSINHNYFVNINSYVLNNSSQPYILATLLHEGLHAYFAWASTNDPKFKSKYPCLGVNANGEITFIIDGEHEYMTKYVNEIADVLKGAYPSLSQFEAEALSWGGLQKTRAYRLNCEALDKIVPKETAKSMDLINITHRKSGCGNY